MKARRRTVFSSLTYVKGSGQYTQVRVFAACMLSVVTHWLHSESPLQSHLVVSLCSTQEGNSCQGTL